jgi:hypothetical protein
VKQNTPVLIFTAVLASGMALNLAAVSNGPKSFCTLDETSLLVCSRNWLIAAGPLLIGVIVIVVAIAQWRETRRQANLAHVPLIERRIAYVHRLRSASILHAVMVETCVELLNEFTRSGSQELLAARVIALNFCKTFDSIVAERNRLSQVVKTKYMNMIDQALALAVESLFIHASRHLAFVNARFARLNSDELTEPERKSEARLITDWVAASASEMQTVSKIVVEAKRLIDLSSRQISELEQEARVMMP